MRLNQRERIIRYIEDFGSITPAEAVEQLGCYKLATRVSEIIREGSFPIRKEMETAKNRYDETVRYMRYSKEISA